MQHQRLQPPPCQPTHLVLPHCQSEHPRPSCRGLPPAVPPNIMQRESVRERVSEMQRGSVQARARCNGRACNRARVHARARVRAREQKKIEPDKKWQGQEDTLCTLVSRSRGKESMRREGHIASSTEGGPHQKMCSRSYIKSSVSPSSSSSFESTGEVSSSSCQCFGATCSSKAFKWCLCRVAARRRRGGDGGDAGTRLE